MGRKGMKGFMKGAQRPKGDNEEGDSDVEAASSSAGANNAAEEPPRSASAPAAKGSDSEDGSATESRSAMLKRHKAEMMAHKKAVQRMGKKSKDELAKINKEIEDRHAAELKALAAREAGGDGDGDAAAPAAPTTIEAVVSGLTLGGGHDGASSTGDKKQSKGAKRREKLEREEAEREARIAEENAAMGPSSRAVEHEQLSALLAPLGLTMREIQADGHCLYRSLADQLAQRAAADGGAEGVPSYQELRERAAKHIRAHPDEFTAFVYDEEKPGSPGEQLEAHCDEMVSSAAWGGQLEIQALAEELECQVEVHAVGMPVVRLGEEFAGNNLRLCYLRHAFGLGAHYNSVEPLPPATASEAEA